MFRMLLGVTVCWLSLATFGASALPAQDTAKKPHKVLITGLVDGEGLDKLVPPGNFITRQEDLDALWKNWLQKGAAPKVDFKKDLVVVAVTRFGPIKDMVLLDRSGAGDMTIQMALERKMETTGFFTLIAVYPRGGIKSIKGRPIPPQ